MIYAENILDALKVFKRHVMGELLGNFEIEKMDNMSLGLFWSSDNINEILLVHVTVKLFRNY